MDNYIYGNVLKVTREDTLIDIDRNLALMKEFGFNSVVIWPSAFWWEEKKEGYPFNTGKEILKIAEKYGIKVIMELAGQISCMEYLPDFLMKEEYHPLTLEGHREYGQPSFGFLNYFHPEVKEYIVEHYKQTAKAYKDFNALLGYDIFNETMFRSFDKYTIKDFQEWLKEKYSVIENLNAIWERTYKDFSQITLERWKWLSIIPETDYCEYRKDAIARFLKPWKDAILSVDNVHLLIADNIHSMTTPNAFYDRPQDDYALKTIVDKIGMSFYPKGTNGCMDNATRWQQFDGYYSASNREGFYISEMQTHVQALFNHTTCVTLNDLKLWCVEGYSAGAEAIIYWMWRPFTSGLQTLGRGLVNHNEKPTERLYFAKDFGEKILKHGKISPLKSKLGILFDKRCDDFQRAYTSAYDVEDNIYLKSIHGAYKAFRNINVRGDIITLNEIFNYDAVILSNHVVLSESDVLTLEEFVKNGGNVIADGRFAIVNETGKTFNILPLGNKNHLAGQIFFDTDNKNSTFTYNGKKINGSLGRQIHTLNGGQVLGRFSDNNNAVVRKVFGKGSVTSINTAVWYKYALNEDKSVENFAKILADEFNLRQIKGKNKLKVRISENNQNYFIFAFNYSNKKIKEKYEFLNKKITAFVNPQDVEIVVLKKEN